MELFFRKYFWVVNLAFILAAAYLSARTVNVFLGARLAPVPEVGAPAGPAIPQGQNKTALSPEAVSKLTGLELPKVEEASEDPAVEDTPALPDFDSQEAVKTGLRVRLVGTLVANRSEWSMANVEDITSHETTVCMVGDMIQSAEVKDIERLRVIIKNNGRKEYIDVEPGTGEIAVSAGPHPAVAVAGPPPPSGPTGAGIRAVSEDNYEVPREEINKALGNLNDIAMQARIVPAFKDGVATGFKLFSIRPNSLYTKIGIQNGDVIRRINGFDINSPDKALEVYTKLKESNRIEIEIDRNGAAVRKTYSVR
jgi:general secretion pathway protein C